MADLRLFGYRYSVYTRVVRMMLLEKALQADYTEVDPFADPPDETLLQMNPFGRVPVLEREAFVLYETAAILEFLEGVAPSPVFMPGTPEAAARMRQIIGIVDSQAYPVLVRQVYSHAVFRPFMGVDGDQTIIDAGLAGAVRVLAALENIAREGFQLRPGQVSIADFHLAPMIAAFAQAPQGRALVQDHPSLAAWFDDISGRASFVATDPGVCLG